VGHVPEPAVHARGVDDRPYPQPAQGAKLLLLPHVQPGPDPHRRERTPSGGPPGCVRSTAPPLAVSDDQWREALSERIAFFCGSSVFISAVACFCRFVRPSTTAKPRGR